MCLLCCRDGCLHGSDLDVRLHSDSLLHSQLSPWFQKMKAGCLHEDHTLYTYKLSTFCLILQAAVTDSSAWLTHTESHVAGTVLSCRWPAIQREPCGMSSTGFTHRQAQPATCLGISLPSCNSQGNGPLPQRCSKPDLVCVHLSRARKANNHSWQGVALLHEYSSILQKCCRTGAFIHGILSGLCWS